MTTDHQPEFVARAAVIAREKARPNADDVDRSQRFPREVFEALRAEGLLVPADPLDVPTLAAAVRVVAAACGSSGLILAMHYAQLAVLFRHGGEVMAPLLSRVRREQCLVSSVASGAFGGDIRQSDAAIERIDDTVRLSREATAASYAEDADLFLITARVSGDARTNNQVLLLAEASQAKLSVTGTWDGMGMRGTGTTPLSISVEVPSSQVFDWSFADIVSQTMVPVTHVLWASAWLGIAGDAVDRAARSLRRNTRDDDTTRELRLLLLARAHNSLDNLTAMTEHGAATWENMSRAVANSLKINASVTAREATLAALDAIGIGGYVDNGGEQSVARHCRDVLSATIMVSNSRLLASNLVLDKLRRPIG